MVAALVGAALLAGLAVFQLLLIAGAPLGRFAWGGRTSVLPTGLRIGSAVSIALYAVFALVVLQTGGISGVLPGGLAGVAIWALAAYFAVGVAMNAASRSRPERLVMTPVALALAVVCLVLALH
ncbi:MULTISPECIES: hypothetical protein [unclassified Geodermatophilus]|uniref:hypothetical protein n=1 Tax=unclassified Geodermatophilus TaxID=2637632 RepID=UPI003EED562E